MKTIYLLNVNDYAPRITALTYPLIHYYANKIGARIEMITERKFPEWPFVYEKLQIYQRAKKNKSEWNIYIDSDALIHPETIDFTNYIQRDTVAHHGTDHAAIRWRYDNYFLRDGRNIGSCNWMTLASYLCIDLWKPIDDMSFEQAVEHIYPTVGELNTVITRDHLIDDYALSRNIAKYGLKVTTLIELQKKIGFTEANFFWHTYTEPEEDKIKHLNEALDVWKIPASIRTYGQ